MVNHWHELGIPLALADALATRGLNFTAIEYVPGNATVWDTPCAEALGGNEIGPNQDAMIPTVHVKLPPFVNAMRSRGIWTFINIVNANGCLQREKDTA